MARGCFVCGARMDRIFILSTPKDKFKLCRKCFEMAKSMANTVEKNDEVELKEDN